MKPYRGEITEWHKVHHPARCLVGEFANTLGYSINGKPMGHPTFVGWIRTSPVVRHEGNEIETLNSRYTLVGEERG